jgi:hypothetical protein
VVVVVPHERKARRGQAPRVARAARAQARQAARRGAAEERAGACALPVLRELFCDDSIGPRGLVARAAQAALLGRQARQARPVSSAVLAARGLLGGRDAGGRDGRAAR